MNLSRHPDIVGWDAKYVSPGVTIALFNVVTPPSGTVAGTVKVV
jgi:hypothetical protein